MTLYHALAFILGWAACVGFMFLWAAVLDFAAERMRDDEPTRQIALGGAAVDQLFSDRARSDRPVSDDKIYHADWSSGGGQ